jgi:RHS repeat-associated protein
MITEPICVREERLYYSVDHLGSVRMLTDSTGAVRAGYNYDAYGQATKLGGDRESDFGFTGFHRHERSGLNFTLNRAYDPALGRWISRDPLEDAELLPEGPNLHAYVANNPGSNIDPDGLIIANVVAGLAGGGIDLVWQLALNGGRWKCISWSSVGIGAAASAAGFGLGSVASKAAQLPRAGRILAKAAAKRVTLTNHWKGQVAAAKTTRQAAAGAAAGLVGAQVIKRVVVEKKPCDDEPEEEP